MYTYALRRQRENIHISELCPNTIKVRQVPTHNCIIIVLFSTACQRYNTLVIIILLFIGPTVEALLSSVFVRRYRGR
jgi:hypothetical protein